MIWPRVLWCCMISINKFCNDSCEIYDMFDYMIIWLTLVCIFLTGLRSSLLMMLLFQAIKDRKVGGEWDLGASWCTRGDHIVEEDQAGLFIFIKECFLLKFYLNVAHFYVKDNYFIFVKPWIHVFIFKFLFNKRAIFMIMIQRCVLNNLWEIRALHRRCIRLSSGLVYSWPNKRFFISQKRNVDFSFHL